MKLHLAIVFAKDMGRMAAFYRDGLGMTILPSQSSVGWIVFDADGPRFALHAIPDVRAQAITISDPPRARSDTPIKLVFQTLELDAVRARLSAMGSALLSGPTNGSWEGLDPEGNVFQLIGP